MGRYTTLEEELLLIKKRSGIKLTESDEVKTKPPCGCDKDDDDKEIITSEEDDNFFTRLAKKLEDQKF